MIKKDKFFNYKNNKEYKLFIKIPKENKYFPIAFDRITYSSRKLESLYSMGRLQPITSVYQNTYFMQGGIFHEGTLKLLGINTGETIFFDVKIQLTSKVYIIKQVLISIDYFNKTMKIIDHINI